MIFFFNLQKLESATKCNSDYIVAALHKAWLGRTIPKNAWEKHKPIPKVVPGSSFLVNAKSLFEDKTTIATFKAHYIRLAGRRDYLSYKMLKQKYLDLTLYPDLDLAAIKQNPLLIIQNNTLKFIYEENNGTLI